MNLKFLYIIGLLAFLCTSCFNVREPEPPSSLSGWLSPTEYTVLLQNFRKATTELNVINYERCFSQTDYKFIPDQTVQANNVGIFQKWSLAEERDYLFNIKEKSVQQGVNKLQFINEKTNNFSADSVEFNADYEWNVFLMDSVYQYKGNISLILTRNESNLWSIRQWTDIKSTQSLCWSEAKEFFLR